MYLSIKESAYGKHRGEGPLEQKKLKTVSRYAEGRYCEQAKTIKHGYSKNWL